LRKIAAILLLAILVFNWVGYRVLTYYLQNKSDSHLQAKIDVDDYAPSDLVELRIPLSLPYMTSWDNFERYDGEIEVNGIHYKYVKRKIVNDSLVLLCLPDVNKTKMEKLNDAYLKNMHNLPSGQGSGKNDLQKNIIPDYWIRQILYGFSVASLSPAVHLLRNTPFLTQYKHNAPGQPPDC